MILKILNQMIVMIPEIESIFNFVIKHNFLNICIVDI
jgi:hypothetical protein